MSGRHQWLFLMMGSLSLAASQWLTLWLLARTASPETVGRYGLALGWVLPAFALAALQLRSLMATEPRLGARLSSYLWLRSIAAGSLSLVLIPLFWLDLPGFGTGALLGAIGLSRLVELASDFVDALRHRDRSYFALGISQCCRSALAFTVFGVVWLSSQQLVTAILSATAAALCSAILIDWPVLNRHWAERPQPIVKEQVKAGRLVNRASAMRKILVFAAPLAIVHFMNLGVIALPRLLLGALSSLDDVATFTCLTSVLGIASLLASAYAASLAPDFAEAFLAVKPSRMIVPGEGFPAIDAHFRHRTRQLVLRTVRNVCFCSVPFVAILAVVGAPLLRMLYGAGIAFPQWAIGFTALFAALWSLAAVFGTAATAARRIGLQLRAFGLALTAGAAAGVILIPAHGAVGASASLLASAIVLLSSYLVAFRHLLFAPPRAAATLLSTDARFSAAID